MTDPATQPVLDPILVIADYAIRTVGMVVIVTLAVKATSWARRMEARIGSAETVGPDGKPGTGLTGAVMDIGSEFREYATRTNGRLDDLDKLVRYGQRPKA